MPRHFTGRNPFRIHETDAGGIEVWMGEPGHAESELTFRTARSNLAALIATLRAGNVGRGPLEVREAGNGLGVEIWEGQPGAGGAAWVGCLHKFFVPCAIEALRNHETDPAHQEGAHQEGAHPDNDDAGRRPAHG